MEPIQNTILTYLSVFAVGLGLNLTPCVYPMLSVTVAVFSHDDSTRTVQAFFKAMVYVLGMATMYSGLGVAVALSGGFLGDWLQHPWVLLAIAGLILLLALSMFGLYRFQVPSWITSRIGRQRRVGLLGLYLSGLLVGIFAAPCIGPPVAALLAVVGSKQDPVFGFWIFFTLSMGLGLPYLVLGTFSHWTRRLPKSGVWLVWVERLFGVILLGFAAYYYIIAMNSDLLPFLIPVVLGLGGLYLGFVEKSGNDRRGFLWFKRGFGCLAIVVAAGMLLIKPTESVQWEPYTPQKLAAAHRSEKPVMMDFYADWCIPCHEMNLTTFRNPKVVRALEGFVRLKVDLTRTRDDATQAIIGQFDIQGVPTYIFYDASGNEVTDVRKVGYVGASDLVRIIDYIDQGG